MRLKSFALLIAIAIGAAIFLDLSAAQAQSVGRTTRDLVFEDDEEVAVAADASVDNPEVISVKTTLDLTRDGQTTSVPTSHEFESGDRVKLRYTTNTDGYAYWMAQMSSGKYQMLFPSPEAGSDNFVKRNENQSVPVKGSFRFDENPGVEKLLIIFAKDRIPDLEKAVAEASKNNGQIDEATTKLASLEQENTAKRTTRDLVFEEEEEEEVSVKTQAAPAGEPFVAYYELTHK